MADASWIVWAMILSAGASLTALMCGVLFFTVSRVFSRINDAVSVVQMLLIALAAVAAYSLGRAAGPALALATLAIGGAATLTIAVLQALLVLRVVAFEQTFAAVLTCGAGIGVWMILASITLAATRIVSGPVLALGIASGIAYTLPLLGYHIGGQEHPLIYGGSLLAIVGYSAWALWLARYLAG